MYFKLWNVDLVRALSTSAFALVVSGCPVSGGGELPRPPAQVTAPPAAAPASNTNDDASGEQATTDAAHRKAGATIQLRPAEIEEVNAQLTLAGETYSALVQYCASGDARAVLPPFSIEYNRARWVESGRSAFTAAGALRAPQEGDRTLEVCIVNWRLDRSFASQVAPQIGAATANAIANAGRIGHPDIRLVVLDRATRKEIAACEACDYDASTPSDTIVTSARFSLSKELLEAVRTSAPDDIHIEITTRHPVELGQEGIVGSFHAVRELDMRAALGVSTAPDGRNATLVVGVGGKGEARAEVTRLMSRSISVAFKRYDDRTDWPEQIFASLLSAVQEQSASWRADEERVACFIFRDGVRLTAALRDAKAVTANLDRTLTEEEKKRTLDVNGSLSWTAASGPGGTAGAKSTMDDRTKREHLAELKRDLDTGGVALTCLELNERGRLASFDEARIRIAVSRVTGTAVHARRWRQALASAFVQRAPVRVELPVKAGQIAVGQHGILATIAAGPLRPGMRVAVSIDASAEATFETSVGYLIAYQPGFESKGVWDLREQRVLRDLRGETSVSADSLLVTIPESGMLAVGIKVDACQSNAGGGNAPSGPLRMKGGKIVVQEVRD